MTTTVADVYPDPLYALHCSELSRVLTLILTTALCGTDFNIPIL